MGGWIQPCRDTGGGLVPVPLPPRTGLAFDVSPLSTANLFLLISSILGAKTAGTHTQFVQWFMEECVDCLEQGSRGSILQFMPFTMVSPAGALSFSLVAGWSGVLLPSSRGSSSAASLSGQVSELVKVSTMSSPKIVLAITDLSLPLGRRVAAKAIAAL